MRQSAFAQDDCKTAAEVWAKVRAANSRRRAAFGLAAVPAVAVPPPVLISAPPPPPVAPPPCPLPLPPPEPAAVEDLAPTIMEVVTATAAHFGLDPQEVTGPRKFVPIVRARQVAMYVAVRYTTNSSMAVGRRFQRDHSTVIHGHRVITDLIKQGDRATIDAVNGIVEHLRMMQARRPSRSVRPLRRPDNDLLKWTAEHTQTLIALWRENPVAAAIPIIAVALDRTDCAIETRLRKLKNKGLL